MVQSNMRYMDILCFALLVFVGIDHVRGDGLHKTPMMGFSSWNTFYRKNDEIKMRGIVDAIVDLGLDKFGYKYVVVDDFWMIRDRDENGNMITNSTRFPSGMKALGDYIHEKGLKYGIYSNAGYLTCGRQEGSLGYEEQDARLFLSFGMDYLKYDNCYPHDTENSHTFDFNATKPPVVYQKPHEQERFEPMTKALLELSPDKQITVELCLYGYANVEEWGPQSPAQLWRTTGDISDNWISVKNNIDHNDQERFVNNQGPEIGWNYPDALFVGKGGMSEYEYRTMFALWCIVKSPLMLGSDLREMTTDSYAYKILTNTDLLAINQDPLGVQGTCIKDCCKQGGIEIFCDNFSNVWQIWKGPLNNGDIALVIVNRFGDKIEVGMRWLSEAGIEPGTYIVRDLWLQQEVSIVTVDEDDSVTWLVSLEAHDSSALRLTPVTNGNLP